MYGDGTVYFVESKSRWVGSLDVTPKGVKKRTRVTVSGRTRAEATRKLRDLQRKVAEGEGIAERSTFAELAVRWLREAAPNRQSPSTLKASRHLIDRHLSPALGHIDVSQVVPEDIERLLKDMASKGYALNTLRKVRSAAALVFGWAERRRMIRWNPARHVELPPAADTKPPRRIEALTLSEAQHLIAAASGHRLQALLEMALTCGMRPGELLGLEWRSVDLTGGTITIRQSLKWHDGQPTIGSTKTGKVRRPLSISPELVTSLIEHRRRQDAERRQLGPGPAKWSELVFTTETGRPLDMANLRRTVRQWAKAAGLSKHVTPYSLRHTACTILCEEGVSIESVADVTGHVDTRMLMLHYRHHTAPSITAAVATGSRILNPNPPSTSGTVSRSAAPSSTYRNSSRSSGDHRSTDSRG